MEKNQNEYYKSLNAKIPLADMVVEDVYQNQINIVKQQQRDIVNTGIAQSISFASIVPNNPHVDLVRRNGLVFGLNEIPGGERNKTYLDAGIYTSEYNKIYNYVGISEKPLGYIFGLSVKFPEIKDEKGNSINLNINTQDLEDKLKENGLTPSLVKEAKPKHQNEYKNFETKPIYQVFFNYAMSEKKIDDFRKMKVEEIKDDFRKGIGKPLEEAINCIINFKLEKYSKIKIA